MNSVEESRIKLLLLQVRIAFATNKFVIIENFAINAKRLLNKNSIEIVNNVYQANYNNCV